MTSELHASPVRRRGRLLFAPGEKFDEEILRPLLSPEAYEKRKRLVLGSAALSTNPTMGPEVPIRRAVGSLLPISWQTPGSRIGIRSVTHEYDEASPEDLMSNFAYPRIFYRFHLSPQHGNALGSLAYSPNARLSNEAAKRHDIRVRTLGFTVLSRELPESVRSLGDIERQEKHMNELLGDRAASVPSYYYVQSRPDVVELS